MNPYPLPTNGRPRVADTDKYNELGRRLGRMPEPEEYADYLAETARPKFQIDSINSEQFAAAEYDLKFHIKKIMVAGQPGIIGGAQKSMKTGVALDAAFSLGTGTPFLGEFHVPEAVPVGFISAESGKYTLQRKAREIALNRGRLLSSALVHWYFKPVQLGISEHIDALCNWITKHELKVMFVDPAYLCMCVDDSGNQINFANLFEVGGLLVRFTERFLELGCTPEILHHESKGANNFRRRGDYGPPELSDLSMAGFAEWARQWVLLGRREPYEQGSGWHQLWANVGGSAGHGGLWAVDVNEGKLQDDFTGRKWEVTVSTGTEARKTTEDDREAVAKRKAAEKAEQQATIDAAKLKVAFDATPDGMTFTQIRKRTNIADERLHPMLNTWEKSKIIERCQFTATNKITYPGYRRFQPASVEPVESPMLPVPPHRAPSSVEEVPLNRGTSTGVCVLCPETTLEEAGDVDLQAITEAFG